jgi:uncharacterized glyoxalase superfamily protein PhnB
MQGTQLRYVIKFVANMEKADKNPAGKVELGFTVADVEAFYRNMSAKGVIFSMPLKKQDFGGVLAQFFDSEGAQCSVGAEAA